MSITTDIFGREDEDCPVIKAQCEYFSYLSDVHNDIVCVHCSHPENKNLHEGNCTETLCPRKKEIRA